MVLIENLEKILHFGTELQFNINHIIDQDFSSHITILLKTIYTSESFHLRNIDKSIMIINESENNVDKKVPIDIEEKDNDIQAKILGIDNLIQNISLIIKLIKFTYKEAKKQDNYVAELALSYALESHSQYAKLLKNFKKQIRRNKYINNDEILVCETCGYIMINKPPQFCPVCGHSSVFFKKLTK
jgi:rubrerythrin